MKPLALITDQDRQALQLVLDKYRTQGWQAAIVSVDPNVDRTTLAYDLKAQNGICHTVRLQKYKGGFFTSDWLVIVASTTQGSNNFQPRGFAVVSKLAPAVDEAEKMMAGSQAQFETLDQAMASLGH